MRRRALAPQVMNRAVITAAPLLLAATLAACRGSSPAAPRVVVWAWQRPEDLRFLARSSVGVAFLAATVRERERERERGGSLIVERRAQPLLLAEPRPPLTAVIRIETREELPLEPARTAALEAAQLPGVAGVQIDFDATRGQRDSYRRLLQALRAALPAGRQSLSITALASWCLGDPWIEGLPIDDAIPMLFRMGADDAAVRRQLESGAGFALPLCRHSVGLATDEPAPRFPPGRRVYLFAPAPWTAAHLNATLKLLRLTP